MKSHIAALILNWNGTDDTIELIQSLTDQEPGDFNLGIYVLDNASNPDQYDRLKKFVDELSKKEEIFIIKSEKNLGIPGGYNYLIEQFDLYDSHILRLDNDIVLLNDAVKRLFNALKKRHSRNIGIIGGNIKYFYDRDKNNGGAIYFDLVKGKCSITYPQHSAFCNGVLGCAMLIDRELNSLLSPYLFDKWLFATTDESELSLRAHKNGFYTYYISDLIAFHKGGRSSNKLSESVQYYSLRNWTFLSFKYYSPRTVLATLFFRQICTLIYKLTKHEFRLAKAIVDGLLHFMKYTVTQLI